MKSTLLLSCLIWVVSIANAAPFRNLDFQSPNFRAFSSENPSVGYLVKDLIPGWQLQIGDQIQQFMSYNGVCLSCPSARLQGPEVPRRGDRLLFVMKTGDVLNAEIPISIFQVGDIPSNARSIVLTGFSEMEFSQWHISLDGQQLGFQTLSEAELIFTGGSVPGKSYGADVSGWAGKTAELRFTAGPVPFGRDVGVALADIRFSSNPLPGIPEPSTWALFSTGVAAFAWNRRRRWRRG